MPPPRLNAPNLITAARIGSCPVIFWLALGTRPAPLMAAFLLFVAASLSDLWDGYLARKHGLITDVGKLLDPFADKLLMASTLIPFYIASHRPDEFAQIPWWGALPLWVLVVIFGREIFVTLFRAWAARRGDVISAGPSGKLKAACQNVFSGALLLWYALVRIGAERGWDGGLWEVWSVLHRAVVGLSLWVAILLTVVSMMVYLWQYRLRSRARADSGRSPA